MTFIVGPGRRGTAFALGVVERDTGAVTDRFKEDA